MAIGADHHDVLRLVLQQGATLVAIGIAVGLIGAAVASRALAGLLFGVSASDPAVYVGVTALLAVVALTACYVPARRAARIQPLEALRYE